MPLGEITFNDSDIFRFNINVRVRECGHGLIRFRGTE